MNNTRSAKYWQAKLDELNRTQLDTVRSTAGKWQGTISTLLGIFGTVAFVTGSNTIEKLSPGDALWAKRAVTIAVILALAAILSATYAAQGLPRRKTNPDWRWLEEKSLTQAGRALGWLRASQALAILAVMMVVASSIIVLWNSEPKQPAAPPKALVRLSNGVVQCGSLVISDRFIAIEAADGTKTPLDAGNEIVTTVTACPV